MATQIIRNQIINDAIDATKLDLSDDYTFTGEIAGEQPTADAHFATKSYVDGLVTSNSYWKEAVKAATDDALSGAYSYSANVITFSANGAMQAVDGITLALNDRVLIKDQDGSNAPHNGIYTLTTVGNGSTQAVLTRSSDMNASDEFKGASVSVLSGTANDNAVFHCSNDTNPTLGSTNITFVQISNQNVSGGDGISVSGNTVAVDRATSSGLTFDSNKLKVNVGDGIEIASDAVKAKVKAGGALVLDASGLDLGSGVIDDAKISVSKLSGASIQNGAIAAAQLASSSVEEAKIASNAVTSAKIAASAVTEAKLSFQSYVDPFTGNGSTTSFDLSQTVNSKFQKMILVFRNGLLLTEAGSPSDVDEYSVALSGGGGGVTRITIGAAPSSSDKLQIRYLA